MAIEGLSSILKQREQQYGSINKKPAATEKENDDMFKLLFDYLEKSNAKIISNCEQILYNQSVFASEISEIREKLNSL